MSVGVVTISPVKLTCLRRVWEGKSSGNAGHSNRNEVKRGISLIPNSGKVIRSFLYRYPFILSFGAKNCFLAG